MIAHDVTIEAPIEAVWACFIDVERWPEWTASVTSLNWVDGPSGGAEFEMPVEGSAMHVGAAVRIKQPRFPRLTWTVTSIQPGVAWTWVARSPGAITSATHELTRLTPSSTRVEQSIEHGGIVGVLVGRLTARLTRRYLAMEAAGLKTRVEGSAPPP